MSDPWLTVLQGDNRVVLPTLAAGSVHCVVTSPPYYALRDYGTATWDGGDPACDHKPDVQPRTERARQGLTGGLDYMAAQEPSYRDRCGKCGAIRQDSQIGLEQTPADYVAALVDVFRAVRRVLRDDGTVWLNLGDSYVSNGFWPGAPSNQGGATGLTRGARSMEQRGRQITKAPGLKPKDLIGVPWRVAFALQADGWFLRSAITLCKRNPMPESVTDRPTSATEMMFLLTKRGSYFYDADAVREPTEPWAANHPDSWATGMAGGHDTMRWSQRQPGMETAGTGEMRSGRNLRNWWEVSSEPYPGAHFATFGQKWITPCILAGCPERTCADCGAPWERVVERTPNNNGYRNGPGGSKTFRNPDRHETPQNGSTLATVARYAVATTGWRPTCQHDGDTVPGVVLDPFAGTGTALLVANKLSRRAIGIDLNGEYLEQLATRNQQTPLGLVG